MKHVRRLTRPNVSPAQSSIVDILTIVGTIMTGVGGVLLTISQALGGK